MWDLSLLGAGLLVAAHGFLSSCGVWDFFLFSGCGARVPEHVGSVVCGMQAL